MTSDRPECHLVCIPPDKVALVWPLARNLIFAAMKRGDLSSFGPVEDSVLRGDALLWLALSYEDGDGVRIDAAAVTELHRTEWRKVCVVVACGAPSGRLGAAGRLQHQGVHEHQGVHAVFAGCCFGGGCFAGHGYAPLDRTLGTNRGICTCRGLRGHSHHRPQGLGARSDIIPDETNSARKGSVIMGGTTKETNTTRRSRRRRSRHRSKGHNRQRSKGRRRGRQRRACLEICSTRLAVCRRIRRLPNPARSASSRPMPRPAIPGLPRSAAWQTPCLPAVDRTGRRWSRRI